MGIPTLGKCVGTDKIQSCFVSEEGAQPPRIIEATCKPLTACAVVNGTATCKPTGACFNGDTRCKDTNTVQTCVNSAWQDASCGVTNACIAHPGAGAACGQQDAGSGITLKGHVDYEYHKPNAALTDFDPAVEQEGAVDLFVTVYDNDQLIGMGLTSTGTGGMKPGDWQVDLSQKPSDKTFVYFWPMLFDNSGNPRMAVAHAESAMVADQASDKYWSFGFGPVCAAPGMCATADMGSQLIKEADGSGAVHIFQWIDYGIFRVESLLPSAGDPLTMAVFWEPGNAFDCGNCFAPPQMGGALVTYDKANNIADHYDSSINISGTDATPSQWARTTINHEFGHWVMQSYSRSPGEGGQHFVDQASKPGLAYSEGWATFSGQSNISNSPSDPDPICFRKSQGTTFWVDLSKVTWSGGALQKPDPNGAIDQPINENIVTAMMWSLWANAKAPNPQNLGDGPLFTVLPSKRLVGGSNRGYPTVDFVDYLDAMKCEGLATDAQASAVTAPLGYPYDNKQLCP